MAKRGASKQEKAARGKPAAVVAPEAWPAWNVERRRISTLTDHPKNVRTHPVGQLANLDASFAEHGAVRPIVINAKGQILAGHGSRDSLLHLHGDVEIPVTVTPDHWTEAQERAFMLRDNAVAAQSGFDKLRLAGELVDLKALGVPDLGKLGFKPAELKRLLPEQPKAGAPDPDAEAMPAPADVISRPGDLWLLGDHKLLCGDATQDADWFKIAPAPISAVFTSPPYGITSATVREHYVPGAERMEALYNARERTGDDWLRMMSDWTSCALRHCAFVVCNVQMLADNKRELISYLGQFADHFVDVAIWDKQTGPPQMQANVFNNDFEFMVMLSHDATPSRSLPFAKFHGSESNIFRYSRNAEGNNPFVEKHRATMPLALAKWAIEIPLAKAVDIVDPFCGTGTTIIAGEQAGRRVSGIELDPSYCDLAITRWEQFTKKSAVLAAGEIERAAVAAARRAEKAATPAEASTGAAA